MRDISLKYVYWDYGHAIAAVSKHGNRAPLSIGELASEAGNTGGPIAGHSKLVSDGAGVSFVTHICEIEVDAETGASHVVCYNVIQDAGKAVHPSYIDGQYQGRAAQGIGWALNKK